MSEEEEASNEPGSEERPRTGLRRRLGRLLNQKDLAEDTRDVLGGMLEMSDRAKTEAVRLVAREARNYLDELKIKEDLLDLVTSHSLEVSLSIHLKPLADSLREPKPEPAAGRKARKDVKAAVAPTPEAAVEPEPDDSVAEVATEEAEVEGAGKARRKAKARTREEPES